MNASPLTAGKKSPRYALPCLKWAGGKRQVLDRLLKHLPRTWGRFHEPFLGGGALFFELNAQGHPPGTWASLIDNNDRLVRTYTAVRDALPAVMDQLVRHTDKHCEDWFYEVRAWDVDEMSDAEVAGWMIYLNKTGFNGLYRVNSKNRFNVPFGRNEAPVICDTVNLPRVSAALRGATIRQGEFDLVEADAKEGDLVYFDPPYVPLNKTAHFTSYTKGGFGPKDQERLRDTALRLKQRGVHVILSNHDTVDVQELYAGDFEVRTIPARRAINSNASKRGDVAEVIIT